MNRDHLIVSLKAPQREEVPRIPPERSVRHIPPERPRRAYGRIVALVLAVALLGALFAVYAWRANGDVGESVTEDPDSIIEAVSRHVVLPPGEEPTVATVSDPSKLRDQPFFASAKAGDKVLLYTKARKAVLYDPVVDRVVEIAPISAGE